VPPKQLPMYAEKSVIAVKPSNKELFTNLLLSRMEEMERDTQKVRLKKNYQIIGEILIGFMWRKFFTAILFLIFFIDNQAMTQL
jgi:hypothetical protein